MVYEGAKSRFNRLGHPLVPCLEHLIPSILTDRLSMRLDIGYMARTDGAKDLDDRSVLAQKMEYTRPVSMTLDRSLERRFKDQAAPPVGTRMVKRPREDFARAGEQGDPLGLEGFALRNTQDSGKSTNAIVRTMSRGPLSKDSGMSVRVSEKPNLNGSLFVG